MIFTSEIKRPVDLILEKYAILIDGYNAFMDAVENNRFELITEADTNTIMTKAKDFVEDAHKFIDETREDLNKKEHLTKIYGYITLGLYIATVISAILAAEMLIPIFIPVIAVIGTLVGLVLTIIKAEQVASGYKKLEEYKSSLIKIKSKVNDPKLKNKIDIIIERIDNETKSYYANSQ